MPCQLRKVILGRNKNYVLLMLSQEKLWFNADDTFHCWLINTFYENTLTDKIQSSSTSKINTLYPNLCSTIITFCTLNIHMWPIRLTSLKQNQSSQHHSFIIPQVGGGDRLEHPRLAEVVPKSCLATSTTWAVSHLAYSNTTPYPQGAHSCQP